MIGLNHKKIILALPIWKSTPKVTKLHGGMTNINYLVEERTKKYVARFAFPSNNLLDLDRKREIFNTTIVASENIGPKVVAFYPKYYLLVLHYLPGIVLSPELAGKEQNIKSIAALLKKLHHGKTFQGEINIFDSILEYVKEVEKRKSWVPGDLPLLLKELGKIKQKIKFKINASCHLDLMMENIISNKSTLKLLDWEYSANSDFRFDLAMLSVKGSFNAKQDTLLLKSYGALDIYEELQFMKAVVYFREASWGLLQLAVSSISYDYKKYALDNLIKFREICSQRL